MIPRPLQLGRSLGSARPVWLLSERSFGRPASFQPMGDRVGKNSCDRGPFRKAFGLAVVLNRNVISFVSCLLCSCCPAAIAGFVALVVVNAVQRVPNWACPHIRKERLKRFFPFIADSYSSAAIISPCLIVLVAATTMCPSPSKPFAASASFVRSVTMREQSIPCHFSRIAPAGFNRTAPYFRQIQFFSDSADASDTNHAFPVSGAKVINNCKPVILLSNCWWNANAHTQNSYKILGYFTKTVVLSEGKNL